MSNNYLERIQNYVLDERVYRCTLEKSIAMIDKNMDYFSDSFPHVSISNRYPKMDNHEWTSGFFPGMVYQAYAYLKDEKFLRNNAFYISSFEARVEGGHMDHHDIGFLYSLTCVALYKLTGDEKAKAIALKAADKLMLRYNEKGGYIQAWGPIGSRYPDVKIIVDCMMNLPLLYWASEVTGEDHYALAAKKHAHTSANTLIREDFSAFHTYMFDPISGRAIEGGTHQGKYDQSTWARGQAWAVYGFILSYIYTKDAKFLEIAEKTADYYLANLPNDWVHYWDFAVSDLKPEMKDTSAASIGVCGLLVLSRFVDQEKAHLYEKSGKIILQQLCNHYFFEIATPGFGLLLESYYGSKAYNECTIWGDYFFIEALRHCVDQEEKSLFW